LAQQIRLPQHERGQVDAGGSGSSSGTSTPAFPSELCSGHLSSDEENTEEDDMWDPYVILY
jgi:hypothetical protein